MQLPVRPHERNLPSGECDLLIAHQDEVEQQLAYLFARRDPTRIGNEYLVIGTLDRADWRRGMKTPLSIQQMVERLHDFEQVVRFERAFG